MGNVDDLRDTKWDAITNDELEEPHAVDMTVT